MVLQQRYGLGLSVRSYAEGTFDDPRLADDAALEGESPSLTLAQRPHDLEALDRGVGRPKPSTPERCWLTTTASRPREERVLRMRFGIGTKSEYTLDEIGLQFSVTRERIRQIEAKALRKLKHPSRARAAHLPRPVGARLGDCGPHPAGRTRLRRPARLPRKGQASHAGRLDAAAQTATATGPNGAASTHPAAVRGTSTINANQAATPRALRHGKERVDLPVDEAQGGGLHSRPAIAVDPLLSATTTRSREWTL